VLNMISKKINNSSLYGYWICHWTFRKLF